MFSPLGETPLLERPIASRAKAKLTANTLFDVTFSGSGSSPSGGTGTIVSSREGMRWCSERSGTESAFRAIANGPEAGRVVAVGDLGTIAWSAHAERLWKAGLSNTKADLTDVAFGQGQFIAVGSYGTS